MFHSRFLPSVVDRAMRFAFISATVIIMFPGSARSQAANASPEASVLFVLVEDHRFGPSAAVLQVFAEPPAPNLDILVLIRRADATPGVVASVADLVRSLRESGRLDRDRDATISVPNVVRPRVASAWASRTLEELVSASPVVIPWLSSAVGPVRSLSVGIDVRRRGLSTSAPRDGAPI